MAYTVYILDSARNGRYYIGFTRDIEARLALHSRGKVTSTKPFRPLKIVYAEEHETSAGARKRERQLKALKSRTALRPLIQQHGPLAQPVRAQS